MSLIYLMVLGALILAVALHYGFEEFLDRVVVRSIKKYKEKRIQKERKIYDDRKPFVSAEPVRTKRP